MNYKITVLMPVYNAGKHLSEAIESILNQSFSDFEFLIIDDGSSDDSIDIVHSYSDPRIRFVANEKNLGITATLNRGIELATCELIARMDADDISLPERLQKQFAHFQKDPECAMVASWVTLMKSDGTVIRVNKKNPAYYYYFQMFNCWIYHPSVMYRKSAVQAVGSYSKTFSEDFNLWAKVIQKYKFHVIPETLVMYRHSDTSLCRVTKKTEYEKAHLEQIIENIQYYTGKDFPLSLSEAQFMRGSKDASIPTKQDIVNGFRKLDYITNCFLKVDNINNRNSNVIKAAALEKKKLIFYSLLRKKSKKELALLLFELSYYDLLYTLVAEKFRKLVSNLVPQKKLESRMI